VHVPAKVGKQLSINNSYERENSIHVPKCAVLRFCIAECVAGDITFTFPIRLIRVTP
jgi:hypothetical protein